MSKSKQIGNLHITTNIKTKAEKMQDQKELFTAIEETLFPVWLEKSKVGYTMDEKKIELWREMLRELYHDKLLNIAETYKQIEYWKGKL